MKLDIKKILLGLACFLHIQSQALEYELHFENESVTAAKVTIFPYEEIGLHRDTTPHVVVALKGGVLTRIEADGRLVDVHFPTGIAVFRCVDPPNELHKTINSSSESIELIIISLKNDTTSNY